MPELPEMETYRNLLTPLLLGKRLQAVTVTRDKSINLPVHAFTDRLLGRTITGISRRAKHLLFHVEQDQVLVLHLMLGGSLFWGTTEQKPDRTVQVELGFGAESLHFIGLRLGYLHLHQLADLHELFRKLGPEPLEPDFQEPNLQAILRQRRTQIKPLLADQHLLAGIGNCYSDEICFEAGLLPSRRANNLNDQEISRLFRSMHALLREAITYGGYMDMPLFEGDTRTGGFDSRCRVYDREGEACVRCGGPILRQDLASRKSFHCPVCQK